MKPISLASIGYVVVGVATALLARGASTPAATTAGRLAAWFLSLAVFVLHFLSERRGHARPISVAWRVALAVAFGALVLAALGPVRAHWGEPSRMRLALLSVVAWPILTGVPAFLVALVGGAALRTPSPAPHQQDA